MSSIFETDHKISVTQVPKVSVFQRFVRFLNNHISRKKSTFVDPGNYEHWAEAINFNDGSDAGISVYDALKEQLNAVVGDQRCATVVLSRTPDMAASRNVYKGTYDFVCDGDHDEVKIQKAYDLVSENGIGKVFLRQGVYDIESTMAFTFPPVGKESAQFSVVVEGEEGTMIRHTIPGLKKDIMLYLDANSGYVRQPTLTFRKLIFESVHIPQVSRLIEMRDIAATPFHLIFDNCGFFIPDEIATFDEGEWKAVNLNGMNKMGNVLFKDCYLKRSYVSSGGLYRSGAMYHLGNVIRAEKLNSIMFDGCMLEDRGARHCFDPFIYTTPVDK